MLNRAYQTSDEDAGDTMLDNAAGDRADLERAAAALVQLEAWTRMRGLGGLATLIDHAACHADRMLTGGQGHPASD